MKDEQAFSEVSHALMRKHYPYRPGNPGAHLCPAKSMVETPTMAATRAHAEPFRSYLVIREVSIFVYQSYLIWFSLDFIREM